MARIIGLTGGIASGKSMVAGMLRELGAEIVDADELARQVVEPGSPALALIVECFGAEILDASGRLDRKKLAAVVFADEGARRDLNAITHPRVRAASQERIAAQFARGAELVVYEAPLIVENKLHEDEWMNGLIVVSAPPEKQLARLMERDHLDEAAASARLAAQLPLADKIAVADYVVDNSGTVEETRAQVVEIWARIASSNSSNGCECVRTRRRPEKAMNDDPATRSDDAEDPRPPETVLITGFPAFTAKRMVAKVLAADATARVYMLTRDKFGSNAREFLDGLPAEHTARVETVVGDVCDMDLGLSGNEFQTLANEVTTIHHLAGIYYMGVDKATAKRVNIEGTRGVLELAGESKRLRRLCHWSTTAVSGKRRGMILEEELDERQSFHNFYEETKFTAEKLAVAAQRHIPITIFRPGIIVGDSKTGEIDKFDGPYYLMVLIVTNALQVHLPLPGRGTAPLHLVPIDYVMDATYALSIDARAAGRTFHITDPNPFSARRVYEMVAERSHTKPPRGFIPSGIARTLLKAPGIERLARAPLAFLESFDHQAFYNCHLAMEMLAGTGIRCPSFDTYADRLVRYVRDVHDARQQEIEDEVFDPFE